MNEVKSQFSPPGAASQPGPTQSGALVPFQVDSQVAATFQRLGVKLTSQDLLIPKGLSSGDFLQLAKAVARVEEIPQWWWGSLWNYSGFAYGERKALTEESEWEGPNYTEWEHQGAAYGLYLEWTAIHKNRARARFLSRSYFVRALSAPPEKRMALLDRCASGEIKNVRELEAEMRRVKEPVSVPNLKSKRVTTTAIEAQVQSDEKPSPKLPTDGGGYGRNEQQKKIDRARIRKCASEKIRQLMDEDKSPWFRTIDDCRLCAEVAPDIWVGRIAELVMVERLSPAQARAQAETEYALDPDQIGRRVRIKLNAAIGQTLDQGPKGLKWIAEVKHPIWDMVRDCAPQDLFALAGFDPKCQPQDLDEASLGEAATEVITRFEQGARSILDVLAARSSQHQHQPPQHTLTPSQSPPEDSSTTQTPLPGKQSAPMRSAEAIRALDRIADLCGNKWREFLLRTPLRISDKDVIAWANETDDYVRKIERLLLGDFKGGVSFAIRFLHEEIDSHTPLDILTSRCLSAGGKFQTNYGSFNITITRGSEFNRSQVNRRLSDSVKDSQEYHQICEALDQNAWKLTDGELAGLGSLSKPLLAKILPCLLYDSQLKDIEREISFGDLEERGA